MTQGEFEKSLANAIRDYGGEGGVAVIFSMLAGFLPLFLKKPDAEGFARLRWMSTLAEGVMSVRTCEMQAAAQADPESFARYLKMMKETIGLIE